MLQQQQQQEQIDDASGAKKDQRNQGEYNGVGAINFQLHYFSFFTIVGDEKLTQQQLSI